jgi:hypothetical protein
MCLLVIIDWLLIMDYSFVNNNLLRVMDLLIILIRSLVINYEVIHRHDSSLNKTYLICQISLLVYIIHQVMKFKNTDIFFLISRVNSNSTY